MKLRHHKIWRENCGGNLIFIFILRASKKNAELLVETSAIIDPVSLCNNSEDPNCQHERCRNVASRTGRLRTVHSATDVQLGNRRFDISKEILHTWDAVILNRLYQLNWLMGVRLKLWDGCRWQAGDEKEEVTPYLGSDWIKTVNFTLEQAMKSRRGSRSIALLFL